MELDSALQIYVAESRDLLGEMEDALLNLEQEENPRHSLNAIFRCAHTIKGSAGLFGLDDIVSFTHVVETLLDELREKDQPVNSDITALLLNCSDHISELVNLIEEGQTSLPDNLRLIGEELIKGLDLHSKSGTAVESHPAGSELAPEHEESAQGDFVESDNWHISVRFYPNALRDGMDPISFIRYLETLGEIVSIRTIDDSMPPIAEFDSECCYLGFEINFQSDADKSAIEGVFDFVRKDSKVRILPPRSRIGDFIRLIKEMPEDELRLGEILMQCGTLTETELAEALEKQKKAENEKNTPLGEMLINESMTHPPVVEAALEKQENIRNGKNRESHSVRVDAEKLDNLINLIGELVIAGAGTSLSASQVGDSGLIESTCNLTRMVEEVRDSALRLRMVQIGSTFNRFKRVVRDVSKELGKDIELVIAGAETDLDKTVIEKISDPLMHLVRNAMDHGIESAEARASKNKRERGTLKLNAYHDSGSIVIEVADDGKGLDRDRILNKAMARGLVSEGHSLDDHEIYNLVFEPGFSTVDEVTNLSGRGVGMDVVKRNITALRGSIELESVPDMGTTCRIRLPLTLAIIDGFLVGVEKSSFVIPLDMVLECVELSAGGGEVRCDRDYINLRGEVLPFIRLRDLFVMGGKPPRRENVVVVQYAGSKAGLVVDQLMGEFQTVIKPLGQIFSHVGGISGSTILGNGEVALILDVPGLVQKLSSNEGLATTKVA